ncbi:hypothetical protein Tco_0740581, partial [Tanacetum coccineum]
LYDFDFKLFQVYDEEEPMEVEKKTKTEKLCDQLTRSILQPFMDTNLRGRVLLRKAYMNARVAGLFLLVLLEYPNGKGVVRATSRGLDMALHWSGVGAAPLMSPRQDETSEPLLYAGWMAGPYRIVQPVCSDFHQSLMSALNSSIGSRRGTKMTAFARISSASKPQETLRILVEGKYEIFHLHFCCISEENVSSRRMLTCEFYGSSTEAKGR